MMKKKSLLICIPEIPYPIRRNGISIRYLPILEHFSKTYEIDLLLLLKNSVDSDDLDKLKGTVTNLYCLILKKNNPNILKKIFIHLRAFVPGQQPLEIYSYNSKEIKSYVISKTGAKYYDVKLSVTLAYAEFIRKYVNADRYVIDSIDSLYGHLHRSYKETLINKYKLLLIRYWELSCISKADSVSYVSPMDPKVLTKVDSRLTNISIVPNGIYIDDYIADKEPIDGFVIGFLGNMDYHPNVQAALKLSDIFNDLKNEFSDLKLLIIGRNPDHDIVDLKKNSGVIVTGGVESIWPYVNATDVFVFPMIFGSGQQNKLLDVMYACRPVISSNLGNSGIGARDNHEIEIADTNDEIKAKIVELYNNADKRERLAKNGKAFIEKKYGWSSVFRKIESEYFSNE